MFVITDVWLERCIWCVVLVHVCSLDFTCFNVRWVCQDETLWQALAKCAMVGTVGGMPGGLDAPVGRGVQNDSSARCWLKILVKGVGN